jgi:hypothetical protein
MGAAVVDMAAAHNRLSHLPHGDVWYTNVINIGSN